MSELKLFGKLIPLLTLNQDETLVHDFCQRNLLSSSPSSLGAHGIQVQPPLEDQEKHEDDKNGRIPLSERKPSSQDKTLKKPDKILPCPRCNSNQTKFCYYNNYNVNQPRHFCKNCQRYWTAGGAMRNVPIGAGRRKTKTSSSAAAAALHYHHHVMISEAILGAQASSVLTFGNSSHLPPPLPTLYRPGFPASFYSLPASSPALGKHSRDEKESVKPESGASNSKALRIDDTDETAKSSMVATLMIKTKNTLNSGGIFNGFRSKTGEDRNCRLRTFSVLQANPAALSRSLNFHENT